ncbi:hypothetical protein [Paenibacillus hexagrammi]|uniref:Lipoprotein n=1 Tax=Paenibacillus hexagrammi TaxID=2908839 RepID=A0ABY3SI11_9BACL|nr:hypothetical protein [Paenibacillus sp. YPD9-1]UJF32874.1 hypothetical protein L0M14_25395 [Paenibacillus sp. YPD9-1]
MRFMLIAGLAVMVIAGTAGCKEANGGNVGNGEASSSSPHVTAMPTPGTSIAPSPSAVPTASAPTVKPSSSATPAPGSKPAGDASGSGTAAPQNSGKPEDAGTSGEDQAKQQVEGRAAEVIQALRAKDMKKLASLVHPEKGVQFSPYSYIDPKKDVRIEAGKLQALWKEGTQMTWGSYDGSGEPITMGLQGYFDKFVYNQDYAAAPDIGYNRIIGKGNMVNNVFEVYPKDRYTTVEYHFSGFDPKFEGNDWCSLRLVFEKVKQDWMLVAVIHDQHTM